MKTGVYNLKNEKVGEIDLPDTVFKAPWKPTLVKQVLDAMQANLRKPWAHAKGRGEVRGGGRKPWRQKGTGRARHGSSRSPLWSGGGKSHGPQKTRDYSQKINKKMRRAALVSVLSRKLKDGEVKIVTGLEVSEPKTKILANHLKSFTANPKINTFDILLIPDAENKTLYRAAANLPKAQALSPLSLNIFDLMRHGQVLIDERAVDSVVKQYGVSGNSVPVAEKPIRRTDTAKTKGYKTKA